MDTLPRNAEPGLHSFLEALDAGDVELWQDDEGVIRAYLPSVCKDVVVAFQHPMPPDHVMPRRRQVQGNRCRGSHGG